MSFDDFGRSADLKVNGFPDGTANADIAKAIVDYFAAQSIKVHAIQQCLNKIARVTFDDNAICGRIRMRVELDMGGVKVPVVPPPPPPKIGLMLWFMVFRMMPLMNTSRTSFTLLALFKLYVTNIGQISPRLQLACVLSE